MADHSRPRHRSKCPVCTRLMSGSDNHPNKCRSCHGCTVDNKCDTCSQWTDVVWAGIMECSQARLNIKRHAILETQASDKQSTKLKPTLRDERSHKRARLQTCSISSDSFLGFSPVPSPEIVQDRNCEYMLEEILNLLHEQRLLPNIVHSVTNRPCAPGGPLSTWAIPDGTARTIVRAVGFPTRESKHLPGSSCQWTYAGRPAPGGKPETFLRSEARYPTGSPEPNPEVDPFGPGH